MTIIRTSFFACLFMAMPLQADEPLPVEVVLVRQLPLMLGTTLTGTIEARHSVQVGFRQGGRVVTVMVNEGDRVARGQALAQTDPTQQQQALRVAQAAENAARASQQQAEQAHSRAEAMLGRGVGTRAALDSAAQELSAAQGSLARAQTRLAQARRALDDTIIRAPQSAVVISRAIETGQIVAAAQPVVTLAAAEELDAVFQTPDMPQLDGAIGLPVAIIGLDANVPAMRATIDEISPLVDPVTGAVTVRAKVHDAPASTSLLGAAVRGTVEFPDGEGIEIPKSALTSTANSPAVWLVEKDMTVRIAPVTIMRFTTESVVLRAGLRPGDRVVGAGSQLAYPGRLVRDQSGAGE